MSMQKKLKKKYSRFASVTSGRRLIQNHPPHIMWTPKKHFFLFLLFGSISEIEPINVRGISYPPALLSHCFPPPLPAAGLALKKKWKKEGWTLDPEKVILFFKAKGLIIILELAPIKILFLY